MRVIVMGAGLVGIASAWYLRQAGCAVTVIDRQPQAALETSFANGGQISVSHAQPWAYPENLLNLFNWLGKEDAPLLFRCRADWQQWRWGLAFLRECFPSRVQRNLKNMVALALYSRAQLKQLRAQLNIDYDQLQRGILHFYVNPKEFAQAQKMSKMLRSLGCDRQLISVQQALEIEPALAALEKKMVGADYTADDESGDARHFTQTLAQHAEQAGVVFQYNTTTTRLVLDKKRIHAAEVIQNGQHQSWEADAFVMALGSESGPLLRGLGIPTLIYPAKGYSATFEIISSIHAPTVSLTDDEYKMVFSRLGNRLRVAGTVEFNGYSRELNPVRCAALTQRAQTLFPHACDYSQPHYWAGLRPATPSNVPLIGATRFSNLFLNTGHGTLGWTMGVGSGAALADIVTGQKLTLEFDFLKP